MALDGDARRPSRAGLLGVGIGIALAIALLVIRIFGAEPPIRRAEWGIGDVALAALVAAPALLARMAVRGRRALFMPAAVLSVALAGVFLSGAGVPLLIPAALYIVAFTRSSPRPKATILGVVVPTLLVFASGVALFVGGNQIVCYRRQEFKDGRVEISRDHTAERASRSGHFTQRSGPPRADVVSEEGGCSEGAIKPVRSLMALGGVVAANIAGAMLVRKEGRA